MIPSELAGLAGILERFEAVRHQAARLGDRLCDLSYANPHPAMEARAREALRAALAEGPAGLQYTPFGGHTRVRRIVADGLRDRLGLPFAFRDVVLTPGATAALQLALRTAGEPGDEVVVPVPCWLDYPLYSRHLGLKPVFVPLAPGTFDLDADAVAAALTPRTCAILLSDPANPTGRVYPRETVEALARVLGAAQAAFGRTITWISDEAHRDFAPPEAFHSPAAAWPATLIVYSYGKYHCLQGQRTGYVAVSPRHPRRTEATEELALWSRITGLGAPTALMQHALPRLESLRHDLAWLDGWRERYMAELTGAGYDVVPPDATYFLYVAVPDGWEDDLAFVRALARAHVLVIPAPVFHQRGYFRISLTAAEPALERALSTLCRFHPVRT